MKERLAITGTVSIVLYDQNGNVKDTREVKNLVVEDGREYIASRMAGTAMGVMSHMGVGTGTTAPAAGQSALVSQATNGRVALTSTTITGTPPINVRYVASFPSGSAGSVVVGNITEAGIFNASSGGVMLCRTTFTAVNKAAADTLSITWNVTVNAA